MHNTYIDKYINFHTTFEPNVTQRGKQLLKKDRVLSADFDEKKNIWTFEVLGTKPYTVKIQMNRQEIETTSCTCPYDWGIICKHTVAALMYLDESNFKEKTAQSYAITKWRSPNEPLELPEGYVYIVDPWWNPAVENQAIDRCYRIGQDKHVFAYRMICKDTVEEKILTLQAKKKKIAQDIIHTDEDIIKNININDISNLFG